VEQIISHGSCGTVGWRIATEVEELFIDAPGRGEGFGTRAEGVFVGLLGSVGGVWRGWG